MTPRALFASQVHAEAHAILALRRVLQYIASGASRLALARLVEGDIARREGAIRLHVGPDGLADAIELAEDGR